MHFKYLVHHSFVYKDCHELAQTRYSTLRITLLQDEVTIAMTSQVYFSQPVKDGY